MKYIIYIFVHFLLQFIPNFFGFVKNLGMTFFQLLLLNTFQSILSIVINFLLFLYTHYSTVPKILFE